jgi:hypothetical protein
LIGTEGQYIISFNLGEEKDFIDGEDFARLTMIEQAGNLLPVYMFNFATQREDILGYLNEANDLKVSFGKSKNELVDAQLVTTSIGGSGGGHNRQLITKGVISSLKYTNDSNISITEEMSGVEAMKLVASNHFNVGDDAKSTFNLEASEDSQRWIQPNISDRMFINNIWLHSYLSESFLACGISSDGRFIVKDMTKQGSEYDWRFTQNPQNENDIKYDSDYDIDIQSGLVNSWVGYGQEKLIYDLENGTEELYAEDVQPVLALTKAIARRAEMERRHHSMGLVTGNTHEFYWRAYLKNLAHLAMFSAVKLTVTFHNQFVPIKILDLCMFRDEDVKSGVQASETLSGLYFVSKVVRTIMNKQMVTVVELVRESVNQVKGEKLAEGISTDATETT